MMMGYAEEPFANISFRDMKELVLDPRPMDRLITPHTSIFSTMYTDIGYLGEYADHVATTNSTEWRQNAESLHADLLARPELIGAAG